MKIVKDIMLMSIVLLLCTSSSLVLFCPEGLNHLTVGFTGIGHVFECVKELAFKLVATYMAAWYGTSNAEYDWRHVGEVILEAFL
jgi:hypothetical protein